MQFELFNINLFYSSNVSELNPCLMFILCSPKVDLKDLFNRPSGYVACQNLRKILTFKMYCHFWGILWGSREMPCVKIVVILDKFLRRINLYLSVNCRAKFLKCFSIAWPEFQFGIELNMLCLLRPPLNSWTLFSSVEGLVLYNNAKISANVKTDWTLIMSLFHKIMHFS